MTTKANPIIDVRPAFESCYFVLRGGLKTMSFGGLSVLAPGQFDKLVGYLIVPLENYQEEINNNRSAIDKTVAQLKLFLSNLK